MRQQARSPGTSNNSQGKLQRQLPISYQTGSIQISALTISLDQTLRLFHLGEQVCISDHSRRISNFSTSLVQSSDHPDNRPFRHVGQIGDLLERLISSVHDSLRIWSRRARSSTHHPTSPLVHDLHQSRLVLLLEIVIRHAAPVLLSLNLVRNAVDDIQTVCQLGQQLRLGVCLFDKHKDRKQCDNLPRSVVCENVLEDKIGQDQLRCRVYLTLMALVFHCAARRTSQATRPLSSTVELSSMNCSLLSTSTRDS